MSVEKYKVGPAIIEVYGNCSVSDEIKNELMSGIFDSENEDPDLQIRVYDSKKLMTFEGEFYSLSGGIAISGSDIMKKEGQFTYVIKNLFEDSKSCELLIYYDVDKSFKRKLRNAISAFRNVNGYLKHESLITLNIMNYSLLWYVFSVVLTNKKAAFIHSSIMQLNNRGLVLAGTGGCGKTSTGLKLVSEKDAKYLAEDFGIVDSEGNAYFSPKNMTIYGTDVRFGQQELVDYISNKMSKWDKFLWNNSLRAGRNPKRKVSPTELFAEEKIGTQTKLKDAYFLVRCECKDVSIEEVSLSEFVDRSMSASFRELKALYEIVKNTEAVSYKNSNRINFRDIEDRIREIYLSAFKNSNTMIIYVPLKSSPDKILDALKG